MTKSLAAIISRVARCLSRRGEKQTIEIHVGKGDHQIAVVFEDRCIARRRAIEEDEGQSTTPAADAASATISPCGRRRVG